MSSSAKSLLASKGAIQEHEESGWTQYLEDFSLEQRENDSGDDDDHSFGSPSMVSDAASPANNNNNRQVFGSVDAMGGLEFPKRLNMKKQIRYQGYSCHDLEDTASSPVNSPKVYNLKLNN